MFAPENGWLEDYFPFGRPIFRGELLVPRRVVSGRVKSQSANHIEK